MNNRRRARIAILRKECRTKTSDMTTLSAQTITNWSCEEKIGRILWGDDLADNAFKEFINLTHGIPYEIKLAWKKTVKTVKMTPPPSRAIDPESLRPLVLSDGTRSLIVNKPVAIGPTLRYDIGRFNG